MREVQRGDRVVVYDDVLSTEDHLRVWNWFNRLAFDPVVPGTLSRRTWDGVSFVGPSFISEGRRKVPKTEPFESVVGALISTLSDEASWLIGSQGERWTDLSVVPNYYPAGAKLGWHNDGPGRAGAFIYYVHRQWSPSWGGELLLLDESASDLWKAAKEASGSQDGLFEHQTEDRALMNGSRSMFIAPKPNRLVVFVADTYHSVARVDSAAGEHARCALAGFYLPPTSTRESSLDRPQLLGTATSLRH